MPTHKDREPEYDPAERAGLDRHERMNNFATSCGVIGCPICNYTGPDRPETAEASLPAGETPEDTTK